MIRLVACSLALLLTACGLGGGEWTKPSSDTTCDDWLGQMTPEQQVDMAGPLLYNAVEAMGGDASTLTDEVMTGDVLKGISDEITRVKTGPACGRCPLRSRRPSKSRSQTSSTMSAMRWTNDRQPSGQLLLT